MVQPVRKLAASASPKAPSRMTLSNVKRGRLEVPFRVLLYGTEGVGKSTWAAAAPSPIFLGTEDGTAHLDVPRLPEPRTWDEILEAVDLLRHETHEYRTLVIDTVDGAEPLCFAAVCADGGKSSIEDFGYGRGYIAAQDKWRELCARLDALRARPDDAGLNIILLGHSQIRTFKNPVDEDYDRYELKLNARGAGVLKEWCDAVFFATFETFAVKKEKRTRGFDSGARIIHTERRAAFDAKNRYGLPPSMPLAWEEFAAGLRAQQPADPAQLRAQIDELVARLAPETAAMAKAAIERAGGDAGKLAQLADWARGKVQLQEVTNGSR